MEHDERITALLEFDFDEGVISVKEQGDPEWRAYRLKDVSTAVYRAERKSCIGSCLVQLFPQIADVKADSVALAARGNISQYLLVDLAVCKHTTLVGCKQ
jgi:hypothetical protein